MIKDIAQNYECVIMVSRGVYMYYTNEQIHVLRKDIYDFLNQILIKINDEKEKYVLASKALSAGRFVLYAGSALALTAGTIAFTKNPRVQLYGGIKLAISSITSAVVGLGICENVDFKNLSEKINFKIDTLEEFHRVLFNIKTNVYDDASVVQCVNYFNQILNEVKDTNLTYAVLKNIFGIDTGLFDSSDWEKNIEKAKIMYKFSKELKNGFAKINEDSYNFYMSNYGEFNGGYDTTNGGHKL